MTAPDDDRQRRFVALFSRHGERLKAYILAMVRDWHRTEDVYQEVGLALWQRFADYDPGRPFIAWARGIARHKILHEWERRRGAMATLPEESLLAVEAAFARADAADAADGRSEALARCLEDVPEPGRRLLDLRYAAGLEHEALARHVGSSVTAVTKALSRLRAALAECIRRRLAEAP